MKMHNDRDDARLHSLDNGMHHLVACLSLGPGAGRALGIVALPLRWRRHEHDGGQRG